MAVLAAAYPGMAADFSGANLSEAHLTNADLRGSNLKGANLAGANLSGSDFRETNITQAQLDSACGYGTVLPAGLTIQPCIPRSDRIEIGKQTPDRKERSSLNAGFSASLEAGQQ
jgi:hypothetical protein